jgi:hypothetical protein
MSFFFFFLLIQNGRYFGLKKKNNCSYFGPAQLRSCHVYTYICNTLHPHNRVELSRNLIIGLPLHLIINFLNIMFVLSTIFVGRL